MGLKQLKLIFVFTLTDNSGINVKNFTAKYLIDITLYRNKTQSKSFAEMSGAVETGHSKWVALTGQQNTTELGSLYVTLRLHFVRCSPPSWRTTLCPLLGTDGKRPLGRPTRRKEVTFKWIFKKWIGRMCTELISLWLAPKGWAL
jgi:hypothetical protein